MQNVSHQVQVDNINSIGVIADFGYKRNLNVLVQKDHKERRERNIEERKADILGPVGRKRFGKSEGDRNKAQRNYPPFISLVETFQCPVMMGIRETDAHKQGINSQVCPREMRMNYPKNETAHEQERSDLQYSRSDKREQEGQRDIKMLLDGERPVMFPNSRQIALKEEQFRENGNDVTFPVQLVSPSVSSDENKSNGERQVKKRIDLETSPDEKATGTYLAIPLVFVKQKAGNEKAGQDKEQVNSDPSYVLHGVDADPVMSEQNKNYSYTPERVNRLETH